MNPNLKKAIVEFIANEFKLPPESISQDTDFSIDLNLNNDQISDLLSRMQDALDFILPEDKVNEIFTLSDLYQSLTPPELTHESI